MNATIVTGRILLVEDETVIREFCTRALTGAGHQVDEAEDGQSGWEALQAGRYDVLVTDNQMPRLTGAELILKLRAAQITLPVILASGNILPEHLAMDSSFQPLTALPKPFTSDQLVATVAEVLRLARPVGHGRGRTRPYLDAPGVPPRHWGLNE